MEAELWQQPKGLKAKLEGNCVIGRSPEADIKVFSSRVSREHAMVRQQGNGFWLYDLGSANGTMLNDREISQPTLLKHGDLISLADIVFLYHVPDEAAAEEQEVPEAPMATVIGVRKTPMILLVTDIMNFSGLSERVGEERVAQILNVWYDDCRAIMDEHEGTIDKFMGDGMFGYWTKTTPLARAQALSAAKLLAGGPKSLPAELRQFLEFEQIPVRCGVGLHIGEASVGSVARGTRTALGDAVNMTFRIESLTRELATSILASSAFLTGWDPGTTKFESVGLQELKGYSDQMELFAIADESEEKS